MALHELVQSHSIRFYGGAMGGGKTYAISGEGISLCVNYPGNRIAYIRKSRTSIERTTFTTFLRLLPPELIAPHGINRNKLTVTLRNGSVALFLGADPSKDPLLEDLKSFEASMIYLEESSQLDEKVFSTAATRKDRWVLPNGTRPPGGICLTSNPEIGWVKDKFYDRFVDGSLPDGWAFIQALPGDNDELSEQYLEDMREILSEEDQRRYLQGEWTAPVDPARLIQYEWIRLAMDTDPVDPETRTIGVDVAFEGNDESVIQPVEFDKAGRWQAGSVTVLKGADEQAVADAARRVWTEFGTDAVVAVDAVGIGSGVATILQRSGVPIVRHKGGEGAIGGLYPKLTFRNLRDQGWWHLRAELAACRGRIPEDKRLEQDLIAPRYKYGGDRRVEVERKVEIKKRLGRSPDRGDALVMALMAARMKGARRVRRARAV